MGPRVPFAPAILTLSLHITLHIYFISSRSFILLYVKDYKVATELVQQKKAVRLASLRSIMGKECLQIYRNLSLTPEQQESVQGCLEALEACFKPQRNVIHERYVFNSCVQSQDEHVDTFVNHLRKLASSCDFGALTNELICDMTDW